MHSNRNLAARTVGRIATASRTACLLIGTMLLGGCTDGTSNDPVEPTQKTDFSSTSAETLADPGVAQLAEFIEARSNQVSTIGKIHKGTHSQWKTMLPKPPQVSFDESKSYYWNLNTNRGLIRVKMWPEIAPMHVSSTIYLTLVGFYNDTKFHRVLNNFMAQGGCPNGTGYGSPGYSYNGEFKAGVGHDRPGLLSMANAGPGTDGSQFFLTFVPYPSLDGKHTIFGEILDDESRTSLKDLQKHGVPFPPGKPTIPLFIKEATISIE